MDKLGDFSTLGDMSARIQDLVDQQQKVSQALPFSCTAGLCATIRSFASAWAGEILRSVRASMLLSP